MIDVNSAFSYLLAERDKLIAEAEQFRAEAVLNAKNMAMLEGERDRLKAELETTKAVLYEQSDLWKSKAEKLAEALKEALEQALCDGDLCAYAWHDDARDALAAYDKETQS